MASGQEAASSCSPLALERGLSAAIGRRLLLLLSYVTLPRGAAALFLEPGLFALAASGSWRLEAGPGWVGLRSKLLMSFALKKSTS